MLLAGGKGLKKAPPPLLSPACTSVAFLAQLTAQPARFPPARQAGRLLFGGRRGRRQGQADCGAHSPALRRGRQPRALGVSLQRPEEGEPFSVPCALSGRPFSTFGWYLAIADMPVAAWALPMYCSSGRAEHLANVRLCMRAKAAGLHVLSAQPPQPLLLPVWQG